MSEMDNASATTEQESAPVSTDADSAGNEKQELKREVLDFVKLIVWFLVVFLFLKSYVIEGYEVQGPSMMPTLQNNERILVLKLPHYLSTSGWFGTFSALDEGDIVVFDSPDNPHKRYVKRVIAMGVPRDRDKKVDALAEEDKVWNPSELVNVVYDGGDVYVQNHKIDEDYLTEDARVSTDHDAVQLGPGEFYVLGDNRKVSKDSRSFHAIEDDQIIGKAVLRFWPPHKIGFLK